MIPYGKHYLDDDDIDAVVRVLKSGSLTQGPSIQEFEEQIATYVGAKYAVAVSSATAGLHLSLIAAGVDARSTVITSPITFVASANAATYVGAQIDFADIDPKNINISVDKIESIIKKNKMVKAIIPVHYAGLPCDMEPIKDLANKFGIEIVEDAAHALGSFYDKESPVGSCKNSLTTVFSMHPVKSIASGEGGIITTNSVECYRKLLRLRSHGINKNDDIFVSLNNAKTGSIGNPWYYEMQDLGFNYRITDFQCALAGSQLKKIELFMKRRRYLVQRYDAYFEGSDKIIPAQIQGREISAHHIYPIRINFAHLKFSRAEIMNRLRGMGIITQVHYIPVPMHPFYSNKGFSIENYPNAMKYYQECLTIPLYFGLADEQQDYIVKSLFEALD